MIQFQHFFYLLSIFPFVVAAYGPFYGNRDLVCNRGTRFACYCSTVTWRRFNRTDYPQCSQLFPGFEAATLEMATCDVRLEDNPYSGASVQDTVDSDDDDNSAATTFERYFKRTLATLIRRECAQSKDDPRCAKIPQDLNEEHIVFTSYQCKKDLRSSRLWMVVLGRPETEETEQETTPQEETHFVDGKSIARVLTSATVLPQLNSHLFAKRSRIMNVDHSRLDDSMKRNVVPKTYKISQPQSQPSRVVNVDSNQDQDPRDQSRPVTEKEAKTDVDFEMDSEKSIMNEQKEGLETATATEEDGHRFNWVAVLVGCLFVAYFLIVWVLAVVFCVRKRREIQAKNRRLRGETQSIDHTEIQDEKRHRVDFKSDPPTTKKLMSPDEDSDYDNK